VARSHRICSSGAASRAKHWGPTSLSSSFSPPTSARNPSASSKSLNLPNIDYGTSFAEWLDIQNGVPTGKQNQVDTEFLRYRRNGRDLAAFTHVDVLYQAYFTAFLVLAGIGAPLNPGNLYNSSTTENGFGTLGGPDIAATLGAVATVALNVVWY